MEANQSFLPQISGALILGVPLILYVTRIAGNNVSAILESISTLERHITLYFSQYYFSFSKDNWKESIGYNSKLVLSWFFVLISWYVGIIIFFSFIFEIPITHPDTLFLLLNFFAIGVRFLIFKKGRQRGEIFSWSISISLFTFVGIGYLITVYNYLAPFINKLGGQFFTSFFSSSLNIHNAFSSSLPSNPFVVFLSFCLFVIAEYSCIRKLTPSCCGPWSLCYEINSQINRIIGTNNIINKAKSLIDKANQDKIPIKWVTTTSRIEIFKYLIDDSNNRVDTEIIMLNSKFPFNLNEVVIPHNVTLSQSTFTQFPRGFLILPDNEVLITSFPFRGMEFDYPSIGFHSDDITILQKFSLIQEKISCNSSPFEVPGHRGNGTSSSPVAGCF